MKLVWMGGVHMRLLLAEDEKSLSSALVAMLEKNHYLVDAVYDGAAALEQLAAKVYDGAILDVMMPKADGITVLKTLRKNGNMIPVIILTARSDVADKVNGLDSGANDYLAKPFDSRELLARIRAMIRVQNPPSEEVLQVGNIQLNPEVYELSSETSSFRLAGKEFQMMEILMTNPDSLIETEYFMDKVWGNGCEEENQVVWVYISFLRKKLKALHANIQITDKNKKAYRLEEVKV